ncbi:TldD/PmbA family protein [Anthocerotibacter panamensis]|uniref:TldD/PmbA family protein n=1 Tax=Anthocerotibacter panamensis TaxID=2857077 RepID=UPI001C406D6A|nr:TldD/PmbA family protein [Anthocerotibacter panamensis]
MDSHALLDLACKSGADHAEVYWTSSSEESINFEANRLKQAEFAQEEGCALTVWLGEQAGVSVVHGAGDPEALVQRALKAARVAPVIGVPRNHNFHHDQPQTQAPLATEQLRTWGDMLIDGLRTEQPQLICQCGVSQEQAEVHILNTEGLDCRASFLAHSAFLAAEWVRGEDFLQVYDGETTRNGDLNLTALVTGCLERVHWAETIAPTLQGDYPVLFTNRAAALIFGPITSALNGRLVSQQASPWWEARGQQVLHPTLTLFQNPTLGPGAIPFDDEGTPTQVIPFIEAGVLQSFYCDLRTAQDLGVATTGNGFRSSLGSFASPGLVNILLTPGTVRWAELLRSMVDGLIVDQVMGNGPGISGDFSVNVELGYRVRHGEVVGRVKDTMIAGNTYTLLKNDPVLSQEANWQGDFYLPHLYLPKVTVTGAV